MPAPTKVYVGNLPDNCNPDTLRGLFDPYGTINELTVIKNYAFVHFVNEKDATNAVQDLHKSKMLGQQITVQVSNSQGKQNNRGGDRDNRRDDRDNNRRRDDRRDDRRDNRGGGRDNRRGPQPFNPIAGLGGINLNPLVNPLGGILGAGPQGEQNVLGNLGIFSAVNTLAAAAAAEQQNRQNELQNQKQVDQRQQPLNTQQQPLNQVQQLLNQQPLNQQPSSLNKPDPDVRVRREVVHTRDVPNANKLGLSEGYVIYERYYVDPNHPLLKGLPVPELPRMTDSYVNSSRDTYRPNSNASEAFRSNNSNAGDTYRPSNNNASDTYRPSNNNATDSYRSSNITTNNDVKKESFDDYHRDRSPVNPAPARRDDFDREQLRDNQRDSRPREYGY